MFLWLFYFFFNLITKRNVQDVYIRSLKLYSEEKYVNYAGYDNRYPKNYSDKISIGKIKQLFQQKEWLSILTNNDVSINTKLNIIRIMDFYNNNSKAGYLFHGIGLD